VDYIGQRVVFEFIRLGEVLFIYGGARWCMHTTVSTEIPSSNNLVPGLMDRPRFVDLQICPCNWVAGMHSCGVVPCFVSSEYVLSPPVRRYVISTFQIESIQYRSTVKHHQDVLRFVG
jgi:hypothetical protein